MSSRESAALLEQEKKPDPQQESDAPRAVPAPGTARADDAQWVRVEAANFQRGIPLPEHPNNGDEARYPSRYANYSKGLPHDALGDVDTLEYSKLLNAITSGDPLAFEAITLGGSRKLANPQAAYAYQLEGADSHAIATAPAPTFESLETSGEMEELYWMSLARDISFLDYATSPPVITEALQRLNQLDVFRGPHTDGQVTPGTLFRDTLPGSRVGPFLSQFLLQDVPYGTQTLSQRIRTRVAGDDRVFTFPEWLRIQNGQPPAQGETLDPTPRYIRNGRDLAEFVHHDFPLQSSLHAALIISAQNDTDRDPSSSPLAHDPNNPYLDYLKQEAFATFGNADGQDLIGRIMKLALFGVWFQKWQVHRRLRPEEFGGRVHNKKTGARDYAVNNELLASPVLPKVFERNNALNGGQGGSYLLAQTFPEGSPLHPSYGSGHSTYVGAGVTMLKAFYRADLPVKKPVVPSADGLSLVPYTGPTLMVDDELDKLAMNIGVGRLFAGVHWRSDHEHAVRLGELIALRVLQDLSRTYSEDFSGYRVRTFGGNALTITATAPALPNHVSSVTGFSLVDGNGQPVPGYEQLHNDVRLKLDTLPAGWRFQVRTFPETVGSVKFVCNGATEYDNDAPYKAPQNTPVAEPGTNTLVATPYSGSGTSGLGGVPHFLRFHVESQWAWTGSLQHGRLGHAAVLLPNGKVLVGPTRDRLTTELYDPATGQWSLTGSVKHARIDYTLTLLANGKVLLAGGIQSGTRVAEAELYDPATGAWSSAGSLVQGRDRHTATLLRDGRVLVVGGSAASQVEVYNPATGWSIPPSQPEFPTLLGQTATLLPDGQVLVVGGHATSPRTQLFNPATNTWTTIAHPGVALQWHTATLLKNGLVLVAGGTRSWLFTPSTRSWAAAGNLVVHHHSHTATLLPNGKVLLVGGLQDDVNSAVPEAELYDPVTKTWKLTARNILPRYSHAAVLLPNGKVLVAGRNLGSTPIRTCELYTPDP